MMGREHLVVVDDLKLRQMLVDVRFTKACPCLEAAAKALRDLPRKCGHCHRKQEKERTNIFRGARNCIAKLDGTQRDQVKNLLNAKHVRIKRIKGNAVINVTI